MTDQYPFSVWETRNGGLVREVGPDVYEFVVAPNFPGLNVGDTMPAEWGIIPAATGGGSDHDFEPFDSPFGIL